MPKLNLTASVTVRDNESKKNAVRCPKVSLVTIRLGDEVVAGATLGGEYTADAALADFKRNHRLPVYTKHHAYPTVVTAQLVR
jgi:hypothetical protein